jgi:hypothetical protein
MKEEDLDLTQKKTHTHKNKSGQIKLVVHSTQTIEASQISVDYSIEFYNHMFTVLTFFFCFNQIYSNSNSNLFCLFCFS